MDHTRDYPVLRDFVHSHMHHLHHHLQHGVVMEKTVRGSRCPSLYLITKHMLLAIIFLMVIWTSLEILYSDQKDKAKYPSDMSESAVAMIRSIVMMGRLLVIVISLFGVFGMIKESFSLSLVFSVFMLIRLTGSLYIPFFNNGIVSTVLICLVTFMSLIFLSLVRRSEQRLIPAPAAGSLRIGVDNSIRV